MVKAVKECKDSVTMAQLPKGTLFVLLDTSHIYMTLGAVYAGINPISNKYSFLDFSTAEVYTPSEDYAKTAKVVPLDIGERVILTQD